MSLYGGAIVNPVRAAQIVKASLTESIEATKEKAQQDVAAVYENLAATQEGAGAALISHENGVTVSEWVDQPTMFAMINNAAIAKSGVAVHLMSFYEPSEVQDVRTIELGGAKYMYFADADRSKCQPPASWIPLERGAWDGSVEKHAKLLKAQSQAAQDALNSDAPEAGMWIMVSAGEINPYMCGGLPVPIGTDSSEWGDGVMMTDAIQACFDTRRPVYLPIGVWPTDDVLKWRSGGRTTLRGENNGLARLWCSNRRFFDGVEGADQSVLHVEAEKTPGEGSFFSNFTVDGGYKGAHGIWFDYTTQAVMTSVVVQAVRGCGLYLKNVQDSTFFKVNVLYSGWTKNSDTPNDPSTQGTDEQKSNNGSPGWSAVELHQNDEGNDGCNMLRFYDCQIEQNADKSPYIRHHKAISCWFINQHSERGPNSDVIDGDGSVIMLINPQFANMRGIAGSGYNTYFVEGGRECGQITTDGDAWYLSNTQANAIATPTNNKYTQVYATNVNFRADIAMQGLIQAANCTFKRLEFKSNPLQGGKRRLLNGCKGDALHVSGLTDYVAARLDVDGGQWGDITVDAGASDVHLGGALSCGKVAYGFIRSCTVGCDVRYARVDTDANNPPNFNALLNPSQYMNSDGMQIGYYVTEYTDSQPAFLKNGSVRAKFPNVLQKGDPQYQYWLSSDGSDNPQWCNGPKLGS